MTAVDELRMALSYAEAWGAASRSLAFRRIAELLVRARGTDDSHLRTEALAKLERMLPQVSPAARRDAARLAAQHWPDQALMRLLQDEPADAVAELVANSPLTDPAGPSLAPEPPITLELTDPAAAPAIVPTHPAIENGERAVEGLREQLRSRLRREHDARLAQLLGEWRWECDARGVLTFVDGNAPADVRETPLLEVEGGDSMWPAFRRQAPFRGVELVIADVSWSVAGVPFFDRPSGRFLGYRGTAARLARGLFGGASGDEFAQVAHEVRSPLNAIMGFAQIIESETLGPTPEVYRRRAGAILDNAQRLLGALDDLTDAARLDRGQWPVAFEAVDAAALVRRIAERHRTLAATRGVAVAATAPPDLPPVRADARSLDRALRRLVAAALAVATDGETLLIGVQRAGADLCLFVTRPGALDALSADQLYDTADAARGGVTAPLLGLGFGLRLVRQLAEAMAGGFAIEPHRFTLTLPAAGEPPVAQIDHSAAALDL